MTTTDREALARLLADLAGWNFDKLSGFGNDCNSKDRYLNRADTIFAWLHSQGFVRQQWRPMDHASAMVAELARIYAPGLGESCTQAVMAENGTQYVIKYDNPDTTKWVWLELPTPPQTQEK